ncbi:MAG: N-acetylneuraminate synthase family protein, partial [Candidatus Portnoybacteria bacterium]|nr:N-acetylneuraminate synthase family protein [Candidatus Portnoybacteria bacterium]
ILTPVMAVALGAKVIEKHFTLDKAMPGPDHKASLSPQELKAMVKAIRETEKSLGSPIKKPSDAEKRIAKVARKSIVAKLPIPRGTLITSDMLIIKRPGTGVAPKYLKTLIGKKAKRDIQKEELLGLKDL